MICASRPGKFFWQRQTAYISYLENCRNVLSNWVKKHYFSTYKKYYSFNIIPLWFFIVGQPEVTGTFSQLRAYGKFIFMSPSILVSWRRWLLRFLVKTVCLEVNLNNLISVVSSNSSCYCLLSYNTVLGILHLSFHLIPTNSFGSFHYMSKEKRLTVDSVIPDLFECMFFRLFLINLV